MIQKKIIQERKKENVCKKGKEFRKERKKNVLKKERMNLGKERKEESSKTRKIKKDQKQKRERIKDEYDPRGGDSSRIRQILHGDGEEQQKWRVSA